MIRVLHAWHGSAPTNSQQPSWEPSNVFRPWHGMSLLSTPCYDLRLCFVLCILSTSYHMTHPNTKTFPLWVLCLSWDEPPVIYVPCQETLFRIWQPVNAPRRTQRPHCLHTACRHLRHIFRQKWYVFSGLEATHLIYWCWLWLWFYRNWWYKTLVSVFKIRLRMLQENFYLGRFLNEITIFEITSQTNVH